MANDLEVINEQLDELLVRQLDLMQDYITITSECESHQKTGFLNLAKTRFIQGYHSISRDSLYSDESEEERQPILTVTRENNKLDLESFEEEDAITIEEPKLLVNPDQSLEIMLNNQFGMLSSGSLKTSKVNFRTCLEKTMERVKICAELDAIKKRYEELMEKKISMKINNLDIASP